MASSLERRVAIDAARAAGHLLKSQFRASHRIAFKDTSIDLVTEMDARARSSSSAGSPAPSRTTRSSPRSAGRRRADRVGDGSSIRSTGTTNYANGLPIFSVSIALESSGGSSSASRTTRASTSSTSPSAAAARL